MVSSERDSSSSEYGPQYRASLNPNWLKGECSDLKLRGPKNQLGDGLANEPNNEKDISSLERDSSLIRRNKTDRKTERLGQTGVCVNPDVEVANPVVFKPREGAVQRATIQQGIDLCIDLRKHDSYSLQQSSREESQVSEMKHASNLVGGQTTKLEENDKDKGETERSLDGNRGRSTNSIVKSMHVKFKYDILILIAKSMNHVDRSRD
ncbi:hypothetical protein LWI29_023000 [Acer saccharum]|uniref:Uncharacterized protein n=1 Tax=Acer saccharum TaxID=4024 RepID=A0AA39VRN3_ACESA|nr:hypothetical protein LWI29_023000 [Acer saccharum]